MSEETIGKQLAEKIWELAMKKEYPELMESYESKSIYDDGTCKPCSDKELPGSMAEFTGTMDGEPLSTEQLHELIVSQSMTIDADKVVK